jgi:hypothetical protein
MLWIRVMVFNATFMNISAISWRSVLLVEETRVPRENHRLVASHWQKLYHIMLYRVHLTWAGFELTTSVELWFGIFLYVCIIIYWQCFVMFCSIILCFGVSERLLFSMKWAIYQPYLSKKKIQSMRCWWCLPCTRPVRRVGFL